MASWISALGRTRSRLAGALTRLVTRGPSLSTEDLDELEERLITADLPVPLVDELLAQVRKGRGTEDDPAAPVKQVLLRHLPPAAGDDLAPGDPTVLLMLGINGSGKTTTCAKLGRRFQLAGRSVLLCAGDTFRAAGSDQLKLWAQRLKLEVVGAVQGADAAAVGYDAVQAARSRGHDLVIIDTAGRMHTKEPLMREIDKMRRALDKACPGAPQETWLTLDAALGKNALRQAATFHEAAPLTGIVVTKLDGSAKGGFLFDLHRQLDLPIRYVGLGEGPDDVAPFDPHRYVEGLLAKEER